MTDSLGVWEITEPGGAIPLVLPLHENSLDEVSRLLPQGFYSTFRTFGRCTRALDLKHHLERLYRPAAELGLRPSVAEGQLRRALSGLLTGYNEGEARVRISLSARERPGTVFAAIEPLKTLPEQVYQRGVRVVTSHVERVDPRRKTTFFITQSGSERKSLAEAGAFEALMVHRGRILEGLTSNFYYVRGGALGTARAGILLGVTRRQVLRLARAEGLALLYRPLRISELGGISEAFLTSSSRGVVPVVTIDGQPVGDGQVGPLARRLRKRYDAYVEARAEPIFAV